MINNIICVYYHNYYKYLHILCFYIFSLILPRKNGVLVKPHFLFRNTYVLSHQESTNYLLNTCRGWMLRARNRKANNIIEKNCEVKT